MENNKEVDWAPAGDEIDNDVDQQKALFLGSSIITFEIKSKKFFSLLPNLKGEFKLSINRKIHIIII